ncbi:MAG TPA: nucleoside hydrolase [Caulobacteraceae bacterium]|nr:nucleoside hydrolase [Caulobacteraceae bacterium]
MTTKLIIDCDPGVDDATALFLAFASSEFDILGVATTDGNVGADQTARNARIIRHMAGRDDVPVYAGCPRPILRDPVEAGNFHGESGLGALEVFDPPVSEEPRHAVNFIIDTVMGHPPESITLAVTGPMTNLAVAMIMQPAIVERLGPVVIMGGARSEGGNIIASAEFNVFADPHAAQVVFGSGCPITVLGLDATHQVRVTPERLEAVRAIDTVAGRAVASLFEFSQGVAAELMDGEDAPVHDPCTIAFLLRPDLFVTRPCQVMVETGSPLTIGHTAVEFRVDPRTASVRWVTRVDADGVFALINERLALL